MSPSLKEKRTEMMRMLYYAKHKKKKNTEKNLHVEASFCSLSVFIRNNIQASQ